MAEDLETSSRRPPAVVSALSNYAADVRPEQRLASLLRHFAAAFRLESVTVQDASGQLVTVGRPDEALGRRTATSDIPLRDAGELIVAGSPQAVSSMAENSELPAWLTIIDIAVRAESRSSRHRAEGPPASLVALSGFLTASTHQAIFRALVAGAQSIVGAHATWYAPIQHGELAIAESLGLRNPEFARHWTLRAGEGVGGKAFTDDIAVVAQDYLHDPRRLPDLKAMADQEDIRSVVVAPVSEPDHVMGLVYCTSRKPHAFTERDAQTLKLLGRTAARQIAALDRGQALTADLDEAISKSEELAGGLEKLDMLSDAFRRGAERNELLEIASQLVGRQLAFVSRDAGVSPPDQSVGDTAWVPVSSESTLFGHLEFGLPGGGGVDTAIIISHTALLLSAVAMRERAVSQAQLDFNLRLFDDLFSGENLQRPTLRTDASLCGLDFSRHCFIVVLRVIEDADAAITTPAAVVSEQARQLFQRVEPESLALEYQGVVVVVVPQEVLGEPKPMNGLRGAVQRLQDLGLLTGAGISRLCLDPADYAAGYREASVAARASEERNLMRLISINDLGTLEAFAHVLDTETMQTAVSHLLAPLGGDSEERFVEDVETLRTLLGSRTLQAAADAAHIHVNTLRYRIQRIEALLGVDLGDPKDRFQVELALRLRDHLS